MERRVAVGRRKDRMKGEKKEERERGREKRERKQFEPMRNGIILTGRGTIFVEKV